MKKLMITACLSILLTSLSAQINKGDFLIEGLVNYNQSNSLRESEPDSWSKKNTGKSENLYLSPRVGYFVNESFLLGLGVSYSQSKYKSTTDFDDYSNHYETTKNMVFINPYITKYHKIGEKLYFNYTFNVLFGKGMDKFEDYDVESYSDYNRKTESKVSEVKLNVTPGLTYFVSDRIAFAANIGRLHYSKSKETLQDVEDEPKTEREYYGLDLSLNTFTLGFQFYLR